MNEEHMDVKEENSTFPKPFWLPAHMSMEDLPAELHAAFAGILGPAYESLVVGGRPGLAQSTGTTVVGILWLEILEYYELGQLSLRQHVDEKDFERKEKTIARLLRLAGQKMKASNFLLRLHETRRRWAKESGTPTPRAEPVSENPAVRIEKWE